MNKSSRPPGKTTIAPEVLVNIVRLTALDVDGVSKLAAIPSSVNRLFERGVNNGGVRIYIENNTVYADIFVILQRDVNVREVSRLIQHQIARAISEMVGMDVGTINVHVEDIDYSTEKSA